MDVQKVLAQADQFLKRGKLQEAAEKFESILKEDPQNEVAANKLALTYLDLDQKPRAVGLYCDIAKRAAEKGKNQKALALYKQAYAVDENDPKVLNGLAEESEQLGKFTDAVKFSELLVSFYLPRKRYLNIIAACARLVRCAPENERAKLIWLEVIRTLADEGKLARALVVFCGPPGLSSPEQQVGGDPSKIGQAVLTQLMALLEWFPADPTLPYALAWVAYRNGNKKNAYRFLAETFRRDPDYCLCALLFARILIEEEKLAEAQYVFRYAKEVLPRDHRTNIKILTEQVSTFERTNGWIAFNEGLGGDALNNDTFLKKIRGEEILSAEAEKTKTTKLKFDETKNQEINLGPKSDGDIAGEDREEFEVTSMTRVLDGDLELSLSGQRIDQSLTNLKAPPTIIAKTVKQSEEEPQGQRNNVDDLLEESTKGEKQGLNDAFFQDIVAPSVQSPVGSEGENTEITKTEAYSPQDLVVASKWEKANQYEMNEATIQVAKQEREAILAQKNKNTKMLLSNEAEEKSAREKSKKPSGVYAGLLGLAGLNRPKLKEEDTGSFVGLTNDALMNDPDEPQTVIIKQPPKLKVEEVSQNEVAVGTEFEEATKLVPVLEIDRCIPISSTAVDEGIELSGQVSEEDNEKTLIVQKDHGRRKGGAQEEKKKEFTSLVPNKVTVGFEGRSGDDEPTQIKPFTMERSEIENRLNIASQGYLVPPVLSQGGANGRPESEDVTSVMKMPQFPPNLKGAKAALPKIPEQRKPPETIEPIELTNLSIPDTDGGTDLINASQESGLEKAKVKKEAIEATQQYIERIEQTKINIRRLIEISDEYLREGNYYLARKASREALEQGADPDLIKEKLHEIRTKELPEGFYKNYSSDSTLDTKNIRVDEIIRGLDRDFDLSLSDELPNFDMRASAKNLRDKIEDQLKDCDPKLRIDLGVAFFEMGFYEEAENQFLNASSLEPARFEGSYLAAQTMKVRGNYLGAIELLGHLLSYGIAQKAETLPVLYLLGESYAALKNENEAQKYFKQVAEIDSNYRNIREKIISEKNG